MPLMIIARHHDLLRWRVVRVRAFSNTIGYTTPFLLVTVGSSCMIQLLDGWLYITDIALLRFLCQNFYKYLRGLQTLPVMPDYKALF